mmetsp:Transcript_31377/g.58511  ORF Transcript_31377/g.58511 Transcript_31377/m.58511 type:complete len:286 (-) Transcript_31377:281-1138(-)
MEYSTFTLARSSAGKAYRRKVAFWTILSVNALLVLLIGHFALSQPPNPELSFGWFGGKDAGENVGPSATPTDPAVGASGLALKEEPRDVTQLPVAQGDGSAANPAVPGGAAATPVNQQPPPPGYAPGYAGYPPMYPPMFSPFHSHFMFIPSWLPSMFFHGLTSIPHMIGGIFNRGHGGWGQNGYHPHETHHHHYHNGQHGHHGGEPVRVGHRYGPSAPKSQENAMAMPLGHTSTSTSTSTTQNNNHHGAVPVSAVPVGHHHHSSHHSSSGHHHSHHHGHSSRRRH